MNVYVMYGKNEEILYVGQTRNMKIRMKQHFGAQREEWKSEVIKIKYMDCHNEVDMNIYELYLINKLKPKYNKGHAYECNTQLNLPYRLRTYNFNNMIDEFLHEEVLTKEEKESFKKLISIYKNTGKSKKNTNYDEEAKEKITPFHSGLNLLTYSWYNKNREGRTKILKNVQELCKLGKAKKSTWSGSVDIEKANLKQYEINNLRNSKDYNYQEGVDYHKVKLLCYIDNNIIYNSDGKVDDYLSVLPLIHFLKRSALSIGEEVFLYLPSVRMRKLLQDYLDDNLHYEN